AGAGKRLLPRHRVYVGDNLTLGPGKVELLAHIAETGSISEAARRMDMSYNRAWLHVKAMNEGFREPLVNSSRGGIEKGGAALTDLGREVLELYQKLTAESLKATRATWNRLSKLLRQEP
ncbi:MAG: winged helix-turn-helix domain-containing protein, partial [Roseimicrobium sp.]